MTMYHISDLKKYLRCPRYYYLSKNFNDKSIPYLRNDYDITALILKKYGIKDYFKGVSRDTNDKFFENQNFEWYVKPRFEYHNLRVKVPLMHKIADNLFDLYYVSMTLFPKEDDLANYVDTEWVLDNLNIGVNKIKIIHLNHQYLRKQDLEPELLFVETSSFYTANGKKGRNIKEAIIEEGKDLDAILFEMEGLDLADFSPIKTHRCYHRNKCAMYGECFGEENEYPENSIMTLVASRNKNRMFKKGIRFLKDAEVKNIEGTKQQYAQIMADRLGGLYIDRLGLKMWLEKLNAYPLIFIDFEWERFLIPPYEKMKPYDVLCFEYSIHILDSDNSLTHKVFLETGDCRLAFIKNLINDIPDTGAIIAFNAMGAECLRIKELAEQFPAYQAKLLSLNDRIIDLSIPFSKGLVYDTRMKGLYSVKMLLSIVCDRDYKDLNISDGMEAVYQWRMIDGKINPDVCKIKQALIEYCSLDTYSMAEIYWWLLRILNNS